MLKLAPCLFFDEFPFVTVLDVKNPLWFSCAYLGAHDVVDARELRLVALVFRHRAMPLSAFQADQWSIWSQQ